MISPSFCTSYHSCRPCHSSACTWRKRNLMCMSCGHAGYGRQDPETAFDCWMTTCSLFTGMCIWTFLGGIVTTLLIHLNAASSEYTAKITALNQYMAHRKLPQVRILNSSFQMLAQDRLRHVRPVPESARHILAIVVTFSSKRVFMV